MSDMKSEEFMNQMLSGIVEKKVTSKGLPDGYQGVDGPTFLKELAIYIEQSDVKFCDCDECPDGNRGHVIEGLMKTALELEMLTDSYMELSEMYDGLLGDHLEESE